VTGTIRFGGISAPTPDIALLGEQVGALRRRLSDAAEVDECLHVVREWDVLRVEMGTYENLVNLRFNQDTATRTASGPAKNGTTPSPGGPNSKCPCSGKCSVTGCALS
jgi:hypothetical protein